MKAFALLASPRSGLPPLDPTAAVRNAARVADEACHIAGDASIQVRCAKLDTDLILIVFQLSWYARRASLAAVYSAAGMTSSVLCLNSKVADRYCRTSSTDLSQDRGCVLGFLAEHLVIPEIIARRGQLVLVIHSEELGRNHQEFWHAFVTHSMPTPSVRQHSANGDRVYTTPWRVLDTDMPAIEQII